MSSFFDQREFDIRCEWGEGGVAHLAPGSDAVVIVDVLSFSTSVDIALSNGAILYPYAGPLDLARAFADSVGAVLADRSRKLDGGYSLAPTSLINLPAGTRLVLPSPNGSTLTLATGQAPTFAGCLRNATAVARSVSKAGRRISVIPAGERWSDGSLRPALEDLLGAGAILQHLPGTRSPEAELAVATFQHFKHALGTCLRQCGSGQELIGRGFETDVDLAAELDVSRSVPFLVDGAYVNHST